MSYYCSTHDLTVPDEVADAARRIIRWAAENDLTGYRVYGLGPVHELHGDLNIAKLQRNAARNLANSHAAELIMRNEECDRLRSHIEQLSRRVTYQQHAKHYYMDNFCRVLDALENVEKENARLKLPLWVKIVAWFAR